MFVWSAAVLIFSSVVPTFAQYGCTSELTFGKACPQNKTSTKWFFDAKLSFCYPYQFLGCDEGSNSFESSDICLESCKPADQFSCGGNTDADGICFSPSDSGCKKGTDCVMGGNIGFCCNKATQDEWNKEHSPTCSKGSVVQFKQWFGMTPLIGRNCAHKFCPAGSTCIQGKWTAHCCQ
ncbi:hypothetical protein L5515_017548 [Caenorhabditis briggsae]|uniref:BPTI/Kunitz inhibitor domain-containing protein n=1 Tax=Caenorhabditis briggsae TaxID=6238 RepID=A0AAE9FDI0_CAEBR|nr:hypothetical protein L5515_017548 [Caenorhabditis briggsae]